MGLPPGPRIGPSAVKLKKPAPMQIGIPTEIYRGVRFVAYGENTMTAEREGESGEDDDDQKWAAASE